ncbi:MAG: type II toxin-antitoxin system RelE/ParE family toxin [Methyloversatilis sp.]|uniref:type II toxin-antitoxin system RelE/ParE family toxin n=1 Tax=Methyloversatilis sp. TaxID=2569862 RepID=UPI002733EA11|nr:type II toxin-antitoxin system RelE/ParE family toxin [Methyloversatilis sp.]MDP3873399.1 type II toxin-antitoxin system RelE/ParE family toxin [Methyloversatilis sp.]
MTYSLHGGAAADVAAAAGFYRREGGKALAARFISEFGRVAELLAGNPGLGTPTEGGRRWFSLYQFPYALIYVEEDKGIHILVVRHQNRDPGHGDERR